VRLRTSQEADVQYTALCDITFIHTVSHTQIYSHMQWHKTDAFSSDSEVSFKIEIKNTNMSSFISRYIQYDDA